MALRHYCREGSLRWVSLLMWAGADPGSKGRHLGWEDIDRILYGRSQQTPSYKVFKTRECIRLLVERGAVWEPADSLRDVRRVLCGIDPEVTVELVGLLLKHRACDDASLHDLLRTPRMKQHMKTSEHRLPRLGLTLDGRCRSKSGSRNPQPSPYVLSRYDRGQLYSEVWSAPTRQVAVRYGISDVALAKVCRLLQIPKPPRGYWAKKVAGKATPRRPKLPPFNAKMT